MKVVLSPNLGFCKGVESAIKRAVNYAKKNRERGTLYFFGELVHNNEVMEYFYSLGAKKVNSPEEVEAPGALIIRAHGISDKDREAFIKRGVEIVDCTCPVVLNGQRLVRESQLPVLVFGYPGHSEVIALVGAGKGEVKVISKEGDLEKLDKKHYRGVVQTTFSNPLLTSILEKASKMNIVIDMANSICSSSVRRRQGVEEISNEMEALVVVGSTHSANANELVETGKRLGKPSFLVEKVEDIPKEIFSYNTVGLTAGASTPKEQYQRVIKKLEVDYNGKC